MCEAAAREGRIETHAPFASSSARGTNICWSVWRWFRGRTHHHRAVGAETGLAEVAETIEEALFFGGRDRI
jgi:hypothetical protein